MAPSLPQPKPARHLSKDEIAQVLSLDVPAHLGTLDARGFPRITAIWFLYDDGIFYMTSVRDRRHLADLARDPRAAVWVDDEGAPPDRPNRQVGGRGLAQVYRDVDGHWTRRITLKYVPGPDGEGRAKRRASMDRWVIAVKPERLIAIGA